jgi:hypothetical protein
MVSVVRDVLRSLRTSNISATLELSPLLRVLFLSLSFPEVEALCFAGTTQSNPDLGGFQTARVGEPW